METINRNKRMTMGYYYDNFLMQYVKIINNPYKYNNSERYRLNEKLLAWYNNPYAGWFHQPLEELIQDDYCLGVEHYRKILEDRKREHESWFKSSVE